MERVWTFRVGRYLVALDIEHDPSYCYDGYDPAGEVQRALDVGDMVAFDSRVRVYFRNTPIGEDTLGGSVYYVGREREFWEGHRDPDPDNRNCTLNPHNVGHYFPDMVKAALGEARRFIKELCPAPC